MRPSVTLFKHGNKVINHLLPPLPKASDPLTTPDVRINPRHRPWNPTSPFPAYPSPAQAHETSAPHTHWLIKQRRSAIGLPQKSKKILAVLGFKKRLQWTMKKFSESAAGNILAVKELVEVKTCTKAYGKAWLERTKDMGEGPGFEVVGRRYGGSKRV
ncbi:hypothetical protein DB88DRAFT_61192 [Papiliotrema laurentii]|uniref:Large ribosomal subunit protein uL30m n=1 Tax=Papiliotrema laurentii TaxID=5418 RepID=A0AAD9L9C4_PAPLA|nr:hypothetical protein DB88DRAFT_61192 [Papiliotrema laurentii]